MHEGVEDVGAEGGGVRIVDVRPLVLCVSVHRDETEGKARETRPRLLRDGVRLSTVWTFLSSKKREREKESTSKTEVTHSSTTRRYRKALSHVPRTPPYAKGLTVNGRLPIPGHAPPRALGASSRRLRASDASERRRRRRWAMPTTRLTLARCCARIHRRELVAPRRFPPFTFVRRKLWRAGLPRTAEIWIPSWIRAIAPSVFHRSNCLALY